MGKYTWHSQDLESEYEDDDGNVYHHLEDLDKGQFALARKFNSQTQFRVVLQPRAAKFDTIEINAKYFFWTTLYPSSEVYLDISTKNYVLVIPLMPGKQYHRLRMTNDKLQHIKLFLATIDALEQCHAKGLIIVDLHSGNILYDDVTERSYLIDGGLSAATGAPLNAHYFRIANERALQSLRVKQKTKEYKKKYAQIAPECYSLADVSATEKMDIFPLGAMMQRVLKRDHPIPEIIILCIACQSDNPDDRPTLTTLKAYLLDLQQMAKCKQLGSPAGLSASAPVKQFILQQISDDKENILMLAERKDSDAVIPILEYIISLGPAVIRSFLQHKKTNVVLILSCLSARLDLAKCILEHIFSFTPEILLPILQQRNDYGLDILMLVVRIYPIAEVKGTLKAVVSLGPDAAGRLLQQINTLGWNALMFAARKMPDVVELLLDVIATVGSDVMHHVFQQTTTIPGKNWNALMLALHYGNPRCIELLLQVIHTLSLEVYVEPPERSAGFSGSPLLSNLEILIKNTHGMKSMLNKIPLELFEHADQLIVFLRLCGECKRELTPKESAHFARILSPKHWYQMASNGWFTSEIKKGKRALVYQHIIGMTKDEQHLVLESCNTSPLGSCLKKKEGCLFDTDYVQKLKNNLKSSHVDPWEAAGYSKLT